MQISEYQISDVMRNSLRNTNRMHNDCTICPFSGSSVLYCSVVILPISYLVRVGIMNGISNISSPLQRTLILNNPSFNLVLFQGVNNIVCVDVCLWVCCFYVVVVSGPDNETN